MRVQTDAKPGKKQVHTLPLSLEEVQAGCLKKVTFTRRRLPAQGGEVEPEERELTVDVTPGLPDGTCFVFDGCAPAASRAARVCFGDVRVTFHVVARGTPAAMQQGHVCAADQQLTSAQADMIGSCLQRGQRAARQGARPRHLRP
jgi:DnaJ C terminal domain